MTEIEFVHVVKTEEKLPEVRKDQEHEAREFYVEMKKESADAWVSNPCVPVPDYNEKLLMFGEETGVCASLWIAKDDEPCITPLPESDSTIPSWWTVSPWSEYLCCTGIGTTIVL